MTNLKYDCSRRVGERKRASERIEKLEHLMPSVEIMRSLRRQIGFAEGFDYFGLHVLDTGDVLQRAGDSQRRFLGDYKSDTFENGRHHDGVGDAGFVFEADEHKTFRRARALAADHRA